MKITRQVGKRVLLLQTFVLICVLGVISCTYSPKEIRTVIKTERAPEAIGPYSQGILVGNTLYTAGQIGLNPNTNEMTGTDIELQARQVLENLKAVVEASGMKMENVVEAQVFLADMSDYSAFNAIYSEYFTESPPARAVIEASALPLNAKVEIKVTAVKVE
ncbi:MAG: RidA family protein [Balneolaceae bacterium]|nr:RidA family protein [Balneolaceae bacterium]